MRRTLSISRVAILLVSLMAGAATPALAEQNCQKAFTPEGSVAGEAALLTGHTEVSCGDIGSTVTLVPKHRMCLERSSWSGFRTFGCTDWVDAPRGVTSKLAGSGCKVGEYDWATASNYKFGGSWEDQRTVNSGANTSVYCEADVPFTPVAVMDDTP
ncbi:MAG TPA: hypothetical protein VGB83_11510 [Actinomycetota bacterium]